MGGFIGFRQFSKIQYQYLIGKKENCIGTPLQNTNLYIICILFIFLVLNQNNNRIKKIPFCFKKYCSETLNKWPNTVSQPSPLWLSCKLQYTSNLVPVFNAAVASLLAVTFGEVLNTFKPEYYSYLALKSFILTEKLILPWILRFWE